VTEVIGAVPALNQIGLLRPLRPDQVIGMVAALRRWGTTPATGYAAAAVRFPDAAAVIDEAGTLSFAEVHRRTSALANALAESGIGEGDNVGVLCRNHRGFVDATIALSKLGADAYFLNTSFAGPQLAEVIKAEKVTGLVYDQEFTESVRQGARRCKRFMAWVDEPTGRRRAGDPTLESLIATHDDHHPAPPAKPGRQVILTSGTTGRPRGANRGVPGTLNPLVAFLSRIPLRYRDTTLVAVARRLASITALITIDLGGLVFGIYVALILRELYLGQWPPLWGILWSTETDWLPFLTVITVLQRVVHVHSQLREAPS